MNSTVKPQNERLANMYVFNLAIDESNPILAFSSQWVVGFSKEVDEISVFSTHIGKNSLPSSIKTTEIGGGGAKKRILGLMILTKAVREIVRNRNSAIVFHHMSPRTAWIVGPFLKFFRVPQGLWYSHSNPTWELRIGARFVDRIFSTTKEALPIDSNNARYVGHGIDLKQFPDFPDSTRTSSIVSLGRVSRIKNNESLIYAVSKARTSEREVHLIGPLFESKVYLESLIALGKRLDVEVKYLGEIAHDLVGETLRGYQMCYTGSPKSVDKSVIEGALSGCFTISDQLSVLNQTGMSEVLKRAGEKFHPDLIEQIKLADSLKERYELRVFIREIAAKKNDVSSLARQIVSELLTI